MEAGVSGAGLSGLSDPDLVDAVRAGDDSAYEELYRRYHWRVTGFVQRIIGDSGRSEEIAQEAFISAWQALRTGDAEISFRAWIYTIARNASFNARRRGAFEEISMSPGEPPLGRADQLRLVSSAATPDDALAAKESLEHLGSAFDELTDNHVRVLVMRELEGLPYREIARRMGLTQGAVQVMLLRARRRLRAQYAEVASGARCAAIDRIASNAGSARDRRVVTLHAARCGRCRRHAHQVGIAVEAATSIRARVAAVLGLPWALRRPVRRQDEGWLSLVAGPGAEGTTALAKAAVLLIAGTLIGGAVTAEREVLSDRDGGRGVAQRPVGPAPEGGMPSARRAAADRRSHAAAARPGTRAEAGSARGENRPAARRASGGATAAAPAATRPRGSSDGQPRGNRLTVPLPATPGGSASVPAPDDQTRRTAPKDPELPALAVAPPVPDAGSLVGVAAPVGTSPPE